MRGLAVLGGWMLVAMGTAAAQDPPLGVPAGVAPIVEAAPAPAPAQPSTSPPGSVFLRPPRAVTLPTLKPVGPAAEELPPLVAPAGSPEPLPMPSETLTLESSPLGLDPLPDARSPKASRPEIDDPGPTAGPRRRGLFGRFLPPPPTVPRPKGPRSRRDESEVDPAADAVLKRKVEAQAISAAGRQARSLDVLVKDRRVTIRARASRPWYRRSLRKALEGLPALVGLKADVDILE